MLFPGPLAATEIQADFMFEGCFRLPSVAVIKHHDLKQLGEDRTYLAYRSQFIFRGNQGRNVEARTMEGRWVLACSPWLSQPAFLYHPESPLGPPIPIINQENALQTCLQVSLS